MKHNGHKIERRLPLGLHHSDPFWDNPFGIKKNDEFDQLNAEDSKFTNGWIIIIGLLLLFIALIIGVIYIFNSIR